MTQLRGTRTLIAYILASALRDRLFLALLVLVALAAALAVFIGDTAIVEKWELEVAYVAVATRLILVAGLVLFVCFHVRRSFENREVELILSRPISRTNYVLAYGISLVILSFLAVMIATIVIWLMARPEPGPLAQWGLSLLLECTIMVLAALFFSLALASAVTTVLACFGLYVLARMIGLLTGIAETTGGEEWHLELIARLMEAISVVIPRLDLFGQTEWLVHGIGGEGGMVALAVPFVAAPVTVPIIAVIVLQGLIYAPLLLTAAIFDMRRRQF